MSEITYLPDDYDEETMKYQFEESYKLLCEINESFESKMKKIFEMKKVNVNKFVNRTELQRHFYYDFIKTGYIPNMNTFISMCMGLNIDLPTAESLLASLRHGFDKRDRLHYAYMFLLTHYQGLCIEQCNEILISLGFSKKNELLGTFIDKE